MKKVFSIVLSLVLVMCMSVTAFAAGGFVSSPSANQAPTVVEFENSDSNCSGTVIVTSYADRNSLSDGARTILEQAAATIQNTADLTKLNDSLSQIASQNKVNPADLAVSDIFNISVTDHAGHDGHGNFDIVLSADTLKNFVALMCFIDGKWQIVEDAKVTNNGTHLEFTEKGMVPYAIVVNSKGATAPSPETADSGFVVACLLVMAMSGAAFVFLSKKDKA